MRTDFLISGSRRKVAPYAFALVLVIVFAGMAALAPQSKAAPVSLTFDNGQMSLGFFQDRVVLPADSSFPSPDLPTPQRTDIQLNGDLSNGQVTIPAVTNTGLQFPYMHIMHPLEQDLKIPITLRLNQPGLTGTWDAASGAMTLEGKLDIIVVTGTGTSFPLPDSLSDVGVPPLGLFARCRFNDVPVAFSTATTSPITARPFSGGFGVNGALTTSWRSLAPAVSENGGECGDLNQLTGSDGAIWLSNGIVEPTPQPPPPPPTCETDISVCPPPTYTEIDAVRLTPNRRATRPGKRVVFRVTVRNSGNVAAVRQRVNIRTNNRRVRVPSRIFINVPAGRSASKRFVARVTGRARGRAIIAAASNGWSARSLLRIQPPKKARNKRR